MRPPPAGATPERLARDAGLAALLQQAAGGDATAFEAFYDGTVAYAQAFARRLVAPADLDDVLADAYFQAWREAARFDDSRGSVVTWLLTIVRSRALDLLRRRRSLAECEATDELLARQVAEAPGPSDLLAACEDGGAVVAALATLSAQERWLLGLAYFRDLTQSQIALATGLPLGTVKSVIQRAHAKLRDRLPR